MKGLPECPKKAQAICKERYIYNPETGILTNRVDNGTRARAGHPAGSLTKQGYLAVTLNRKNYMVHRICYLIHYGEWPDQIDHINRVKDDNRICNLRSVTPLENMKNLPVYANNTSGVTGVRYRKHARKWLAEIGIGKSRQKHLGYFATKEEAVAARKKAEVELGFMEPN